MGFELDDLGNGTFAVTTFGYGPGDMNTVLYSEPGYANDFRTGPQITGNDSAVVQSGEKVWRVWLRSSVGVETAAQFVQASLASDPLHYSLLRWMQKELCELALEEIGDHVYVHEFPHEQNIEFPGIIVSPLLNFSARPFDTCGRLDAGYPTYLFVAERADPDDEERLKPHLRWFEAFIENFIGKRPANFGKDQFRLWEIQPSNIMEEMKGSWQYIRIVFPLIMRTHKLPREG